MDVMVSHLTCLLLLLSGAQCSIKKGIGIGKKHFQCNDLKALEKIHWWYDWAANFDKIEAASPPCIIGDEYISSYIPMIWGDKPTYAARSFVVDYASDYLLGFNEPNHHNQANMSPEEAVAAWPRFEQIAGNRKIVSPAAARCGGTSCNYNLETDWFDKFFELLCADELVNGVRPKTCRVDYLATHVYKCKKAQVERALLALYERYNLKIWLTEFACPNNNSPQDQLNFMKDVLPYLEGADYVYRYAWFVHRTDAASNAFITSAVSLLEQGSSTLNELGRYYANYGVTTTSTTSTTSTTTSTTPSTTSTTTSTTSSTTSTTTSTTPSTTSTTSSTTSSTSSSSSSSSATPTASSTGTPESTTEGSNAGRHISMLNDITYRILWLCVVALNLNFIPAC